MRNWAVKIIRKRISDLRRQAHVQVGGAEVLISKLRRLRGV